MLDNISNRTLLIVPNNLKNYILETINKENKLINIKVMTIKEFSDAYFFSYTKETIHFLVNKYNISVENAILFLDNMKYVLNLKNTSNKSGSNFKYSEINWNSINRGDVNAV